MMHGARVILTAAIAALAVMLSLSYTLNAEVAPKEFAHADAVPVEDAPRVALVFGAGLNADGTATAILYDRVATAVDLYRAGRVKRLLLSGDNRTVQHNEPLAMLKVAQALGLPREALIPDYAGWRTYDTCYRAREIFSVRRAILVTQQFHLARALYTCLNLGVDSLGVVADRRSYGADNYTYWTLREVPSLAQAFIDVNVLHPVPVLGDKLPIE